MIGCQVRDKDDKMLQKGRGCDYRNRRGPHGDSGHRDLAVIKPHTHSTSETGAI